MGVERLGGWATAGGERLGDSGRRADPPGTQRRASTGGQGAGVWPSGEGVWGSGLASVSVEYPSETVKVRMSD